jgi:hypothetical protein
MTLSKFNVTLPTLDTAGNALTTGEITSLVFVVNGNSYAATVAANTAPGAALVVPFASLLPPFVPGSAVYTADVYAVDANGNGTPSASISFNTAVPAAPTGFSVG